MENIGDFKPARVPPKTGREMVVHYVDRAGKPRVQGGRDLKKSQSYPLGLLGFGKLRCFQELWVH